jgi:hypothetical protein
VPAGSRNQKPCEPPTKQRYKAGDADARKPTDAAPDLPGRPALDRQAVLL